MEIPDKGWIAVGTVLAAVIAGLISFVNILIAKDQKTTELRQAWIDALRAAMSEFAAHAVNVISVRNVTLPVAEEYNKRPDTRDQAFSQLRDFFEAQQKPSLELRNRILLYLNPKEHTKLIEDVKKLHAATLLSSEIDGVQTQKMADDLLEQTQKILKYEWERVKKGEAFYRSTKYILAFLLVVTLGGVIYATARSWNLFLP